MLMFAQQVVPRVQIAEPRGDGLAYVLIGLVVIAVLLLTIWIYRSRSRATPRGHSVRSSAPPPVVSPERAQAGARAGFEGYGLLARPDWRPLLLGQPLRTPVLVRRLDTDDYYYLVPVGPSDELVGAVARVDGGTGEYLECNGFQPRGAERSWGSMLVRSRSADAGNAAAEPEFVWKPCVESRSPYYPFRVVGVGDRARYVRIDGKEFDALTDLWPATPDY